MLSFEDIQRYFWGSWRIMNGHADGLDFFDLSEEGFWQSFHAVTVSLPPLILKWIVVANDALAYRPEAGTRVSLIGRLAFVDLTSWFLPLVVLLFLAPRIGLRNRYSIYVIANNWGTALVNWLVVPATLVHVFMPARPQLTLGVALVLNSIALAFIYRLTHVALKKTHAYTAVFFTVLVIGYIVMALVLQSVLGIALPEPVTIG
jgi:hypothetical protein